MRLHYELITGWLAVSIGLLSANGVRAQDACEQARLSKLQLLHSADNESSLQDPNTLETKILNYAALHAGLRTLAEQECIPSMHVTAGDHTIPGPFYQASAEIPDFGAPGLADIAMYNAMQLQANGIGNHEFDGGINDFAGLIARTPADFFNVIADPATTLPGLDFVGGRDPMTNQPLVSAVGQVLEQVAALEAQGIKRIVLLDHAQDFTADPLSATELRGIDIIVAAGSTGFMAPLTCCGKKTLPKPAICTSGPLLDIHNLI